MENKTPDVMTLCGGSCKSCPDVAVVGDKRLSLSEFGQNVVFNEEQLQMIVKFARAKGFDV